MSPAQYYAHSLWEARKTGKELYTAANLRVDVLRHPSYHLDDPMSVHRHPVAGEQSLPAIPDKLYFRIGEVAQIAGVEPYVLRYWESEFPSLAPKKSGTGHRLYRRKEVELILEVKRLLYEKRFTIEGARLYLEQNKKRAAKPAAKPPVVTEAQQGSLFGLSPRVLDTIRQEIVDILNTLR